MALATALGAAGAEPVFYNDAKIPMRDGINLAADIYLPSNRAEKIGCFLSFSPYKATASDSPWYPERAEAWGVATMAVDCRGLCHSEGVFEPWDPALPDDAWDLLDWISSQPWSNGRVVMVGGSYPGATQLACMRSGHPALVACAPSVVSFDAYSINYANGILLTPFQKGWHCGLAGEKSWIELTKHADPADPYWTARSDRRDLAKTRSRAFYQAGWYDKLGVATFESFAEMPSGSFLRVGPWSHGVNTFDEPDINYSSKAGRGGSVTEDLELDFLRSALEGYEPQTAKLPGKILMYVMGRNEWRYENQWPPKGAQDRDLHFTDGFGLSFAPDAATGADEFAYDPENPVPSRGGRIIHAGGQYEQSDIEARDDVLCYTTPVLDKDVEVVGNVVAHIRATSTAPVADVAVKLVDVHPDGKAYNVIDSIARGSFAPGKATSLDFRVDVTAFAFLKGHRIRVEIAGSCAPHYDKADLPARTSLLRGGADGSRIVLPVLDGRAR